ncbi:protein mono-ADP-ribosyltransferase PARP12 [Hyalella azteca]|uniref:Poly [ADP-ribose] polymerase n=1 Tax=Hyalella azteca TaxID=294128 RepID=A0A8B7P2W7_HYAAZ|nr:protein mono-ADP-ribosyltransferase PARP12 [Hyalella azteca]
MASSDDIELEFSVNGRKTWSTHSAQNTYNLDFVKMIQTNQETQVSRRMRRRPKAGILTPGSGPIGDYTPTPMPGTSFLKRYKWQFMDEHNNWIEYGKVSSGNDQSCVVTSTSADLERQFSKNPTSVIQLQSNTHKYSLDFASMKQTNLQTQVTRNVRRIVEDRDPSPGLSFLNLFQDENENEILGDEYEWFFFDENNQWIKYGQTSSGNDANCVPFQGSDEIEKHFRSQPDQVMTIKSRQHTYELNLATMTQTNVSTKVQRPMSRMIKNSDGTNGNVAVSLQVAYEWYFKEDDGSWVKHGSKGNSVNAGDIEKYYRSNPTSNYNFTAGNQSYVLDFVNMTQTNTSTGKVREVLRRKQVVSMTGAACGSSNNHVSNQPFGQIPSGQACSATPLATNNPEYAKILALLRSHIQNCSPNNIHKVNNPYLKAAFDIKKSQLQSQYPSVAYREERLFHGTKSANIKAILEENIDWRLHGSNRGQSIGRGAYFSNNAQTSRGYGNAIFICKVLVGLVTTGNSQTVKPPKDSSNRPFDTTVDQPANPSVFVKYDSQEYYPEYYAEF